MKKILLGIAALAVVACGPKNTDTAAGDVTADDTTAIDARTDTTGYQAGNQGDTLNAGNAGDTLNLGNQADTADVGIGGNRGVTTDTTSNRVPPGQADTSMMGVPQDTSMMGGQRDTSGYMAAPQDTSMMGGQQDTSMMGGQQDTSGYIGGQQDTAMMGDTSAMGGVSDTSANAAANSGVTSSGNMNVSDTAAAGAAGGEVTVQLQPKEGSSASGTVTLRAAGASQTEVRLELQHEPMGTTGHAAHIHEGTCASPGAPVHPLETAKGKEKGHAKSTTTVNAAMSTLTDGNHIVQVHKTAAKSSPGIACAEISSSGTGSLQSPN
jgi:hypothetical protein